MVVTGLEKLLSQPHILDGKGRVGLLYNQASVDSRLRLAPNLIFDRFPGKLTTLFGPQHGAAGTEQDNMVETAHGVHSRLELPLTSLYSATRKPFPEMLESVDTVLVDLQDVGTRVYTFATTVLYLMQGCSALGKQVIVLDRPNPINGRNVEGALLKPTYTSFVGPYPVPMRHGMTMGELMNFYNDTMDVGCGLEVVPMVGWKRDMWFDDTGLPWVMPSPNMPCLQTAMVYPGQVILEGTNVSEGRGTTRPFEIFGAPYIEPDHVVALLEPGALAGAVLREVEFRPTFNKWSGELCRGFQLHVTDRNTFQPYRSSLAIISALLRLYPHDFNWAEPPYEYVFDQLPIDVILGDPQVRQGLEGGLSISDLEQEWRQELEDFRCRTRPSLLYPC